MELDSCRLFLQINTLEGYTILLIALLAFLIGFVVGILLRSGRLQRLNRELQKSKAALTQMKAESAGRGNAGLREKDAEIDRLNKEAAEARRRTAELEREKNYLYDELKNINAELEKFQSSKASYLTTIEDLNDQILGLQAEQEDRSAFAEREDPAAPPDTIYEQRLKAIEAKLLHLEEENTSLKKELTVLRSESLEISGPGVVGKAPATETPKESPLLIDEEQEDDLTLIQGIGPFIAEKLRRLGIFTLEQISRWETPEIQRVTEKLEFFEGRIEKDDWVGQARRLEALKHDDPEAFRRLSSRPADPKDLQVIEGIDAPIEQALKAAGIFNWESLSESSDSRLREILDAAGLLYREEELKTWPVQARMANDRDWSLLDDYRRKLKEVFPAPPPENEE